MKKRNFLFRRGLVIFLILSAIAIFRFVPNILMCFPMKWHGSAKDIDMYQNDYMTIVDLAFRLREESGKERIILSVGYDVDIEDPGDLFSMSMATGIYLYLYEDEGGRRLDISAEEYQSIWNISENSFGDGRYGLDSINAFENQVEFSSEGRPYALIYTRDGAEPVKRKEYENAKAVYKKINAHWYHMRLDFNAT